MPGAEDGAERRRRPSRRKSTADSVDARRAAAAERRSGALPPPPWLRLPGELEAFHQYSHEKPLPASSRAHRQLRSSQDILERSRPPRSIHRTPQRRGPAASRPRRPPRARPRGAGPPAAAPPAPEPPRRLLSMCGTARPAPGTGLGSASVLCSCDGGWRWWPGRAGAAGRRVMQKGEKRPLPIPAPSFPSPNASGFCGVA